MRRIPPALILLIAAVLAYGLLIPQLGFYWDDLPMSWIRYQLGPEAMTEYFSTNRPVWGWLYQVTTWLIPQVPLYWQLLALTFRWLGAVVVLAIVRELFPGREKLALGLSLLFLLYPGFNQQWGAYLYSHFFIVLFFFLSSIYLMLRRRTIPALIFSALNLWMMEYFFVLELVRPFVIWTSLHVGYMTSAAPSKPKQGSDFLESLREESSVPGNRLKRTLGLWAPYLAVFALAVLSRLFVFNNQVYGFSIRNELAEAPLPTLLLLGKNILLSVWTVTGAAWIQAFQFPNPETDGPRTVALYALVTLGVGALILFFSWKRDDGQERSDARWLIGLGVVMLILAGPPFWLTNVPVSLGFPANRATLAFMLGASFLLMGLIDLIPAKARFAFVILLAAFAAGRQFLWSNEFRRDWAYQKNLFWQMTWRAPGLEPGTMVLMNEELEYYADNSLGAALNWIYAPDNHSDRVDYVLFYPTNRIEHSLPELESDIAIHYDFLAGEFDGSTSQAVVFYYAPPGCLRLLDPDIDPSNRLIPDETLLRDAAVLSSSSPIITDTTSRMPGIYFPEPPHGWCYYFEKADLARQMEDWEQVVELGDAAFSLDDHPNDPIERFVFIEGYAHVGQWERAQELSLDSYRVSKNYVGPLLCSLWSRIDDETADTAQKRQAVDEVRIKSDCSP